MGKKTDFSNELFEHWCNNPDCEESINDPDKSNEGIRYVLDGEITLDRTERCVVCDGPLTNRLDVILTNVLKEHKIDLPTDMTP